jgi:hypothetical protein
MDSKLLKSIGEAVLWTMLILAFFGGFGGCSYLRSIGKVREIEAQTKYEEVINQRLNKVEGDATGR